MNPQQNNAANAQIAALMATLINPLATNKTAKHIDIMEMARLKNGGFPQWYYHATLAPVHAINQDQADALIKAGFDVRYKHQEFPKYMFKRNMAERYKATLFVEERKFATAELLESAGEGWFSTPTLLEPLPGAEKESIDVVRARLEGQLEEARRKLEALRPKDSKKAA